MASFPWPLRREPGAGLVEKVATGGDQGVGSERRLSFASGDPQAPRPHGKGAGRRARDNLGTPLFVPDRVRALAIRVTMAPAGSVNVGHLFLTPVEGK